MGVIQQQGLHSDEKPPSLHEKLGAVGAEFSASDTDLEPSEMVVSGEVGSRPPAASGRAAPDRACGPDCGA